MTDELWRGACARSAFALPRLNRALERSGRVFADRYHARQLKTPAEVRNALRYVLNNYLHHGRGGAKPDPCSSGRAFDGWRDRCVHELATAPVCAARSWLLRVGWRKRGRIGLAELPVGAG